MNFLNITDNCGGLGPIIDLIKRVLSIAFILIGVVLVVLIIIDIAKSIIASEEKEVKGYQKAAIRRVIYFVVMFFVVTLVTLVTNLLGDTAGINDGDAKGWAKCWSDPKSQCSTTTDATDDNSLPTCQ